MIIIYFIDHPGEIVVWTAGVDGSTTVGFKCIVQGHLDKDGETRNETTHPGVHRCLLYPLNYLLYHLLM